MKRNRLLAAAAALILAAAVTALSGCGGRGALYSDAVSEAQAGAYSLAADKLEQLGDYRDSAALLNYCRAQLAFGGSDENACRQAEEFLEQIPDDYDGPCAGSIGGLRLRVRAAREQLAVRRTAPVSRNFSNDLPYAGMSAADVGKTLLGECDQTDETWENGEKRTRCRWTAADGEPVFTALSDGKTVTRAYRENIDRYWDGKTLYPGGKPSAAQTQTPAAQPRYTGGSDSSDPCDASAYSEADDFYYDHPDDFYDYEDAEEYWEAHR